MANQMKLTLLLTATDQMTRTVANAARGSISIMNGMQANIQKRANQARTGMLDSAMAAFGGFNLMKAPIEAAGGFERLRISMDALTGSMQKGGKVYSQVVELAKNTPLTLDQVAQNTTVLLGMGDAAETVVGNVKMLGDITALTNGDLNRAAIAYGQARQMGKLLTRDIYQMINAGVPLKKMFDDVYGSGFDLYGSAEKGILTFDKLQNVLEKTTGAGGQFYDGLGKLRASLEGTTNALLAEWQMAIAEFGNTVLPVVKSAMEALMPMLRAFGEFVKNHPNIARAVFALVTAFTALAAIGFVMNGVIWAGATAIDGFIRVSGILGDGIGLLTKLFRGPFGVALRLAVSGIWQLTQSIWVASTATIQVLIPVIGSAIASIRNLTVVQWLLNAAMLANPVGLIVAGIVALIAYVGVAIYKWKEFGATMLLALGPIYWVLNTMKSVYEHWGDIMDAFSSGGIIAGIKAFGKAILDGMLYPIQQMLDLLGRFTGMDMFKSASKAVYDFRSKMDMVGNTNTARAAVESTGQTVNNQSYATNTTSTINPVSSGGTAFNYSPVLNIAAGVSESAISNIIENDRREFQKQMEDAQRRKAERRYA